MGSDCHSPIQIGNLHIKGDIIFPCHVTCNILQRQRYLAIPDPGHPIERHGTRPSCKQYDLTITLAPDPKLHDAFFAGEGKFSYPQK